MKKILKNKVALLLVGAIVVGFGGTVAYLSMTNNTKKDSQSQNDTKSSENSGKQAEKGDLPTDQPTTTNVPAPVQEKAPTDNSTNLGSLASSVTAQKNTSDDSIDILFYLEGSGTFTSQSQSGSSWVTVKENQSYGGRGGFLAETIPAGQGSITMRVLKIENGKYTAVTKEFTVNRAEVEAALGIKTYN